MIQRKTKTRKGDTDLGLGIVNGQGHVTERGGQSQETDGETETETENTPEDQGQPTCVMKQSCNQKLYDLYIPFLPMDKLNA